MFGQLSWSRLVMARLAGRCGCSSQCSADYTSGRSNRFIVNTRYISRRCYSAVASGIDHRYNANANGVNIQCRIKEHLNVKRYFHCRQAQKTILSNHIKLHRFLVNTNVKDGVLPCILNSCSMLEITSGRFYSDIKNDEELKSMLKEIRKDFGNETGNERIINIDDGSEENGDMKESHESMTKLLELSNKLAGVDSEQSGADVMSDSSSSSSDDETPSSESSSDSDAEDNAESKDADNVPDREAGREKTVDAANISDLTEKQGYTVEEMIDILKEMKYPADHEEYDDAEILEDGSTHEISDKTDNNTNFQYASHSTSSQSDDPATSSSSAEWSVVELEDFTTDAKAEHDGQRRGVATVSNSDVKTDWSVVEIEDFVNIAEAEPDMEAPWNPPVGLTRGKTGVYDIEDLVAVLRAANAVDIVVMRLPDQVEFADYMVVVSAKSIRHLKAITADVRWIYKQRKSRRDKYVRLEGEGTEWCALDLGNIVLHLFMPRTRELYDLETLWTLGPKFDPKCMEEPDPYVYSVDDLPWLKELEESQSSEKSPDQVDQSEK